MALHTPSAEPLEPVVSSQEQTVVEGEVLETVIHESESDDSVVERGYDSGPRHLGMRRAVATGALVAGGLGVAGGVGLVAEGATPHPTVNGKTSEQMIKLNDRMHNSGELALEVGAVLFVAGYGFRKINERFDANLRATNRSQTVRRVGLGLSVLLVSAAGAGSALGAAASEGATKPVDAVAHGLSPNNPAGVEFITQHPHALAFDHSEVATTDMIRLDNAVVKEGGTLMPYSFLLGDLRHEDPNAHNPSSSAIVLLPNQALEARYGVSMPNQGTLQKGKVAVEDCLDNSVITNQQFGARVGDTVLLENKPVKVVKTIDEYPGLDRAIAIGSLEQQLGCITSKDILSGAAVSGLSHQQVEQVMKKLGMPYAATDYEAYKKEYSDFWDKSVKPVEMQEILLTFLASLGGLGAVKMIEIINRRQVLAAQDRAGTSRGTMVRREFARSVAESVKAAAFAPLLTYEFVNMNNGAQLGIAEKLNWSTLGTGFEVGLAANLVATVVGAVYIHRMNMAKAERS